MSNVSFVAVIGLILMALLVTFLPFNGAGIVGQVMFVLCMGAIIWDVTLGRWRRRDKEVGDE